MAGKPVVLVVGATGMVGRAIVAALVSQNEATVQGMYRTSEEIETLRALGAAPVAGDVMDPGSLEPALQAANVVISAVGNVPSVQVEGQKNLIAAARRAGVDRFIPSDFSVDFLKLDRGDHVNLDMRKDVQVALEASGVPATHVLNGAFMDVAFSAGGIVDPQAGTFTYFGDGEQLCDFTSVTDTARYTAAAATDPQAPEVLRIAGDVLSMKQAKQACERALGMTLQANVAGTTQDLEKMIAAAKASADDPMEYVMLQYQWAMVTGKAKLEPLDNARYPWIEPTSLEAFVRQQSIDSHT
jgi:uncharacterized protein YbjT (DUF2867 family)